MSVLRCGLAILWYELRFAMSNASECAARRMLGMGLMICFTGYCIF